MFKKIPYKRADEILHLYSPEAAFTLLAAQHLSPSSLIDAAIAEELFSDIITFLAHALPIREAIWWSACCASTRNDWNEPEQDAIRAAKAWVHMPDEITRRHAAEMATLAELKTGAGWAAQAAFWSGGSMTKPKDPVVPPPPYLYAQAVAGSVNLTALLPNGDNAKQQYLHFISIGINIAHGGNGTK